MRDRNPVLETLTRLALLGCRVRITAEADKYGPRFQIQINEPEKELLGINYHINDISLSYGAFDVVEMETMHALRAIERARFDRQVREEIEEALANLP